MTLAQKALAKRTLLKLKGTKACSPQAISRYFSKRAFTQRFFLLQAANRVHALSPATTPTGTSRFVRLPSTRTQSLSPRSRNPPEHSLWPPVNGRAVAGCPKRSLSLEETTKNRTLHPKLFSFFLGIRAFHFQVYRHKAGYSVPSVPPPHPTATAAP